MVSLTEGAPTVRDAAISLSRIPRFAGNGWEWFPVAKHCLIVADLLPAPLQIYGLLHDGPECVGSDVPKPVKTAITSRREDAIFERMCLALALPPLDEKTWAIIKRADIDALYGEIHARLGPPGMEIEYEGHRHPRAEKLAHMYHVTWDANQCVDRYGPLQEEFYQRAIKYLLARRKWEADLVAKHFTKPSPFVILNK